MTVATLENTAAPADILAILARDGAVIVRNLVSREFMDAMAAELDPYFAETPTGEGYFVGFRTKRMGGLVAKSRTCRELAMQPAVLAVANAVLGPWCNAIQLNLTQAIRIEPGELAQVFHKDDELFPFEHNGIECMINALWAYDDFTVENGATRVVVGSHTNPVDRMPAESEIDYAAMPKGSVLIYLGSTLHSGGANVSARHRTAITMSYNLGWLRQAENQYLAAPPELARTLPRALQALLGYAIHSPNLGWYEGQDPSVVLTGERRTLAARDYMPPDLVEQLRQYHASLRQSAA